MQVTVNATISAGGTTAANYIVNNQTELDAAMTAATSGQVIEFSTAVDGSFTLAGFSKTAVTLRAQAGAQVRKLDMTNTSGITLSGLTMRNPNTGNLLYGYTGAQGSGINSTGIITASGCSIALVDCEIDSTPSSGNRRNRIAGIQATSSTISVVRCNIHHVYDAIVASYCDLTVTDSQLHHILVDAVTGRNLSLTFLRNKIYYFQGYSGKRLNLTGYTGTQPSVGDYYYTTTAPYRGGKIVEVLGANSYNLIYNEFEKPQFNDVLVREGSSDSMIIGPFNEDESLTGVSTLFDGPHGDGIQQLLNGTTSDQNFRSIIAENMAYRYTQETAKAPLGDDESILSESNFQFLLDQRNGGAGRFLNPRIENNMVASGNSIGITYQNATGGTIRNNTVLSPQPEVSAVTPMRIRIGYCDGTTISGNIHDYSSNGIIEAYPNTNCTITNNLGIVPSAYAANWAALNTPYDTLSKFTPLAGSTAASAGAGALLTDGSLNIAT